MITPPPLDHCYADWAGRAEITRPEHGLRLTITADDIFRFAVVYTPADKPYFAVEPASNMTDAVNRMDTVPDHGLRVLQPGGDAAAAGAVWGGGGLGGTAKNAGPQKFGRDFWNARRQSEVDQIFRVLTGQRD